MTKKIDLNLKGVPQTLLLPLFGRARLSQAEYSPLHDEKAVELMNSINYDCGDLLQRLEGITYFWMARAYHFDEAAKAFLKKHPKAVIVSLGAGLETAFYRVDNGELTWVNLDLPEVMQLREQLLPLKPREHAIAKSILDFSWMDEVQKLGDEFFFFAGGLFMYLTEKQNKALFTELARRFPNAELIFDSISVKGLFYANRALGQSTMKDAVMHWGLDDAQQLKQWSPHIDVAASYPSFVKIKTRAKVPFKVRVKMFLYDMFDKGGIVHLRFV